MKLDPEPIRMAAVVVYNPSSDIMGHFSCVALHRCTTEMPYVPSKYTEVYQRLFRPDTISHDGYWGKSKTPEYQHQRSIALLLLAEMAETGDL